jgi:hypothetical protein
MLHRPALASPNSGSTPHVGRRAGRGRGLPIEIAWDVDRRREGIGMPQTATTLTHATVAKRPNPHAPP